MVVGHDHADPGFLCGPDRLCRSDSVVTGQDQADSVLYGILYHLGIHAVPVPDPVRQHDIRPGSAGRKRPEQDIGSADPIDVIIPDHTDRHAFKDLSGQDLHGTLHIRQEPRIMQVLQPAIQKPPRLARSDHVPVADHTGQYRRDPAFLRDRAEILPLLIDHPFCHLRTPFTELRSPDPPGCTV